MNYLTNEYELTNIANTIRKATCADNLLEFPTDFISAFSGLESWPSIEPVSDGDIIGYIASRTSIASNTFRGSWITFASFPSVSIMSSTAFSGCLSLKAVTFNNLKVIPIGAFYNCSALEYANFPACTTIIFSGPVNDVPYSYNAFSNCTALKEIKMSNIPSLPNGSIYYPSEGVFRSKYTGVFSSLTSLEIVDLQNCVTIGSYAFYSCSNLKEINIPNCKYINRGGLMGCKKLITINLPECLIVNDFGFYDCDELAYISLPKCTSIGASAFYHCYQLKSISIPACTSIEIFGLYATGLTEIDLPQCSLIIPYMLPSTIQKINCNAKLIADFTFYQYSSLNTVILPNCTSINEVAFMQCSNLTTISIPNCSIISVSAFVSCNNLSTISLPNCNEICSNVFYNCEKLISIYLMNSSFVNITSADAFWGTPINGYTAQTDGQLGHIYVPMSLLTNYLTHSIWSYYSSRFIGI